MAKILLITNDWPPRLGGVAQYYFNLMKHSPDVLVLTDIAEASSEQVVKISWSWPGWPRWLPLLWQLPLWRFKLKVKFLAAGQILPIGTALLLIRLAFGWPYLVFLHGLDVQLTQRNTWKRFLSKQILKRSAGVITNSNFTAQLAIKAGVEPSRIQVIYPSVAPIAANEEESSLIKRKYGLENKKIILTVARLVERKGIRQVIEAISKLENKYSDLAYVIVGDGPIKADLEAQARKLKSPVIFTGAVSDNDKFLWYSTADVFVLTPLFDKTDVEGFGIVYLEAQAAGRPIIASKVGGVPEAVGQAGILLEPGADLSAALEQLLSDYNLLLSFSQAAKEQISKFSSQTQIDKFNEYIKNLNN